MRTSLAIPLLILSAALSACTGVVPSTSPSGSAAADANPSPGPTTTEAAAPATQPDYSSLEKLLGSKGARHGDVFTITLPRNDLIVINDMGLLPTEAGLESRFHFFRCTCGKEFVIGEFILADYEANDVMDALRAGQLLVTGMSPVLLGERPKIVSVRFQGEGSVQSIGKTIHDALEWVGDQRSATQPAD